MRGLSVELTRKTDRAAEAQMDGVSKLHAAAQRLQSAQEAHEQGKWRRMGVIALIGALCGAVGFFAREPASKFDHFWEARNALKLDATDADCKTLGGETMPSNDRLACVIWQDAS
ncbi:hypothetical protein GGR95_003804 [Sulfitobacter undariae]|uniref:Uncharacterized protein n=2 Tax=Sulfitobacter undariae TaxID=1563671 RepID=A0A7W6H1Q0_9RHOB|nr:hypothetical protein [Sulfitobacter undariae]